MSALFKIPVVGPQWPQDIQTNLWQITRRYYVDDTGKHVNIVNKAWLCMTVITYLICACNIKCENDGSSVVSDSVRPHRQQPTRLPRPWDSPGKNTGVGCHVLPQGIFPTQELNLHLLLGRRLCHCTAWETLHLYKVPGIIKCIESESTPAVPGAGRGNGGLVFNGARVSV